MATERLERAARVQEHLIEHGPHYTGLAGVLAMNVNGVKGDVLMVWVSMGLVVLSFAVMIGDRIANERKW